MNEQEIEKLAQVLSDNIRGFELRTLSTFGSAIKEVGSLSAEQVKTIENLIDLNIPLSKIYEDLASVTTSNIEEVKKVLEQVTASEHFKNKKLYDYKGKEFVPYNKNPYLTRLIENWSIETSKQMLNLSRTKAIGTTIDGVFYDIDNAFYKTVDKAIVSVRTGVGDFQNEMQHTVNELGNSGVVTNYGSGVTRSLESTVRQWMLYGIKQSSQDYFDYIGEEIGADGFEVDYHSHPRPSHEFMGGRIFSYNGDKVIDGIHYSDGTEALARLTDYGCLHMKHPVILGISEPAYNNEDLQEFKEKDKELVEYNGKKKTRYEWQQYQRGIEREIRHNQNDVILGQSAGFDTTRANQNITDYENLYKDLCKKVGLQQTPERYELNLTK